MRFLLLSSAVILAACGRSAPAPLAPAPVSSSSEAVRAFMQAAADSNLTRMGDLWGTSRGPARPGDLEKRLVVMQAYLRADSIRVLSDQPKRGRDDERDVMVQLFRGTCLKQVPFTAVRTGSGGWLVQNVDIGAAGNPARPCP